MSLPPPLTLSYWFSLAPLPFLPLVSRAILLVCILLLSGGVAAFLAQKKRKPLDRLMKKAMRDIGTTLIITGLSGLVLAWFAYERATMLSMRALWLPLIGWFGWRAWQHWRCLRRDIPQTRAAFAERAAFEKWLPKPKR